MGAPLSGIRVLELAEFIAVPSAGALLCDMGADVTKIEPPEGDPWRDLANSDSYGFDFPISYAFELDNRGKRSITLDLHRPESIRVILRLAEMADILLTNMLPYRLERYGVDYKNLCARNRRLIYLAFNAYGHLGPERDRLGLDIEALWSRAGVSSLFGEPGGPPPFVPSVLADHLTAPLLVAGVLAALIDREHSGEGQEVTGSLLNTGLWGISSYLQETLVAHREPRRYSRTNARNPLSNSYRTKDGRWLSLGIFDTDINWSRVCAAIGRPDLVTDPRYDTLESRKRHSRELIALLDDTFASGTLEEWSPRLNSQWINWAPVQHMSEVLEDPQVKANPFFTTVEHPNYGPYETIETPIHFSKSRVGVQGPAPEVGQHTEEILLEAGYTWEEITDLRDCGAMG